MCAPAQKPSPLTELTSEDAALLLASGEDEDGTLLGGSSLLATGEGDRGSGRSFGGVTCLVHIIEPIGLSGFDNLGFFVLTGRFFCGEKEWRTCR